MGMLFGGYGAQGVKFKRVKGVYVMTRKRIAVLTAQADEYTQGRFLSGFFEKAFQLDYDVCVFSMYLKYQDTASREVGDANIFNLIEFDKYDAVVICTDRIRTPGTEEGLRWRVEHEFDGPVLIVGDEIEGYKSINIDHRKNICGLTDHLIEEHGYRDIVLLDGWENTANSELKKQGFFDSMKSHGIDVDESSVYYGNNWFDSGRQTAMEITENRDRLPQAVVCASDHMALGLAAELEQRGVRVPEDIAITGYDAAETSDDRVIPLTSVDIPAKVDGEYAAKWIDAEINGRSLENYRSSASIHWGKSCGCEQCTEKPGKRDVTAWDMNAQPGSYGSYYNHMMEDLLSQRDYREFYNTIFQYAHTDGNMSSFSLCLNEYWKFPEVMMGSNALRVGYTKNIYRVIRSCGDGDGAIDFDDCFDVSRAGCRQG